MTSQTDPKLFVPTSSPASGVTVYAPLAAADSESQFRFFTPTGYAGKVGGSGNVLGTSGFQDITVVDLPGIISFDPSFNRGGDVIRLSGKAGDYTVATGGSAAILSDGDTVINIPVGSIGTQLVFEDGVRKIAVSSGSLKLGSQTVSSVPAQIVAGTDNSPLPGGANPTATARTFLAAGAIISVGGDQQVYGSIGTETLTYLGGDVTLDPSFNRGGDKLILTDMPWNYSAYAAGSSVILLAPEGQITIPVGTAGITIDFGGNEFMLRYDSASATLKFGDLSLAGTSALRPLELAALVSPKGTVASIDIGSGASVEHVTLEAGKAFVLTDDATKDTNVEIHGFDGDDVIQVAAASASDYNFSSGDADSDNQGDDLLISFVNQGTINVITIFDAVAPTALIMDRASAEAAVGHQFIAFDNEPVAQVPASVTGGATGGGTGGSGPAGGAGSGGAAARSQSIDVGDGATVVAINLQANASYVLADDATKTSHVIINGFGQGDVIHVSGAQASDYNFSTGDDPNDLEIAYQNGGAFNMITITDAIAHDGLVTNLASAQAAVGFQFITFG